MPQNKEVHREYMRKRRADIKIEEASQFPNQIVNEDTVTRDGVVLPRYVTLSDGQVMDRAYKPDVRPLPGWMITAIRASNRADSEFKPNQGNLYDLKDRYDVRS